MEGLVVGWGRDSTVYDTVRRKSGRKGKGKMCSFTVSHQLKLNLHLTHIITRAHSRYIAFEYPTIYVHSTAKRTGYDKILEVSDEIENRKARIGIGRVGHFADSNHSSLSPP